MTKKKALWLCGIYECRAHTKSEARSIFKQMSSNKKRLPVGVKVERVKERETE